MRLPACSPRALGWTIARGHQRIRVHSTGDPARTGGRHCSSASAELSALERPSTPSRRRAAGSCSSPARRASGRPPSCARSARPSAAARGPVGRLRRPVHAAAARSVRSTSPRDAGGALAERRRRGRAGRTTSPRRCCGARARPATVVVLEDLHWADEATLDVLRLLGPAHRPGAGAGRRHLPRRRARPDASAAPRARRAGAARAVERAARARRCRRRRSRARGAARRRRRTSSTAQTAGNPFFVTEVLAAGGGGDPGDRPRRRARPRRAAEPGGPRRLLDAVAVVPRAAELWLLEALAGDARRRRSRSAWPRACSRRRRARSAFRHELARLAVEESLAPAPPPRAAPRGARGARRRRPAARPISRGWPTTPRRPATATPCCATRRGRARAPRRSARTARRRPSTGGRCASPTPRRSGARPTCSSAAPTRATCTDAARRRDRRARQALECYRQAGDRLGRATRSCRCRGCCCAPGERARPSPAGREAVELLEQFPPGRELALAYAQHARRWPERRGRRRARARGARGRSRSRERLDDAEASSTPSNSLGTMESCRRPGRPRAARAQPRAGAGGRPRRARRCGRTRTSPGPALRAPRPRGGRRASATPASPYCPEPRLRPLAAVSARLSASRSSSTRAAGTRRRSPRRWCCAMPRSSPLPRVLGCVTLGLVRAAAATRARRRRSTRRTRWPSRRASCSGSGPSPPPGPRRPG